MNGKLRFQHELTCLHPVGARIVYCNPYSNGDPYSQVRSFRLSLAHPSQGIVHSVDATQTFYTIRSRVGTLDCNVPCQNVFVQTSTPFLSFEPTSSLPRYVETDPAMATSSPATSAFASTNLNFGNKNLFHGGYVSYKSDAKVSTSTAHLVRLLKFARFWEECPERRSLVTSHPNLDSLCGQLVWVLVMTIADHSWLGNDFDALMRQLEEIDHLAQVGNSSSSHWISSESWNLIREWLSRMIGRILGPHRSHATWSYDYTDMEESFETIYLPPKQKRYEVLGSLLWLTLFSCAL
jgi:hypothetical protein